MSDLGYYQSIFPQITFWHPVSKNKWPNVLFHTGRTTFNLLAPNNKNLEKKKIKEHEP